VAYLQQVCGHEPKVIHRVLQLLRVHDQESSFLESPAVTLARPSILRPWPRGRAR
jgi:hypothetical protein